MTTASSLSGSTKAPNFGLLNALASFSDQQGIRDFN
jgi:hypothetical protein